MCLPGELVDISKKPLGFGIPMLLLSEQCIKQWTLNPCVECLKYNEATFIALIQQIGLRMVTPDFEIYADTRCSLKEM